MDSKTYWKNREETQRQKYIKDEAAYQKEIEEIYNYMLDQIQREINGFYAKYAKKEGITLSEAKKRVSKLDMETYERKAAKYVKEKNFSEEANEEMRLYNATMKINRLEMLKANIGLELVGGFNDLQKYFDTILTDRTLSEFKRQAGILGKTIRNNEKAAHAIVNASFHNAKFSDRIWMYQDMLKNELAQLLRTGLIQGKNPRELAKHLTKRFGVSKENAERLMQTELARVQTEAQKQSLEQNGFTQYTFIALGSACGICKEIDGKHFDLDKMMPGTNAPPMHPRCHCSVAAYEDDEEYEAWLDFLDRGGTTEEWNQLKKERKKSIIEPDDEGDLYTTLDQLSGDLLECSLQVNNYLNTLGLPESKWSGRTFIKTKEQLKPAGRKKRNCDIWLREDAPIKTVIHEHLHARSISRIGHLGTESLGYEEGAVELLAEELCKRSNVSYIPTYSRYVEPLRTIHSIIWKDEDIYSFSVELFKIDYGKRKEWLKKQTDLWTGKNILRIISKKKLQELIDSIEE